MGIEIIYILSILFEICSRFRIPHPQSDQDMLLPFPTIRNGIHPSRLRKK